jgi:hypothetical protein
MTAENMGTQTMTMKDIKMYAWGAFYLVLSGAMIWGVQVMSAWQNQ